MAYSEKVVDHYENPRNVGSFEKGDDTVGTGMVGAPACGDVMKLQIKVNPLTGVIEDARFKTYGCGSAIASSSLVTEWVKGKTLDEAASIKNSAIAEELALPPVKIHCSILAEDAIKAEEIVLATMSVTLTDAAARHVTRYMTKRGKGVGVRLGVKTTGCSGLAYKLEYADEIAPEDVVFEDNGVKVLVDPKSMAYIDGTQLDFVREGLNEGFKFSNPNERDRCGCGESFRV
jgi:nitrogen fixation NifU-like protein